MITRSHIVNVLFRGNVKQNDLISGIMRSKASMAEIASNREPEDSHPNFFPTEEINEYHISSTGAKITTDSSISVLNQYCDKLPKDKYGDYISILSSYMATQIIYIQKF
jgi:endoribonuclease Dicer